MADFIYVVGVDLGQARDYTAISIVELIEGRWLSGTAKEPEVHVRHLERVPLGTSYPDVVARVTQLRQALGWVSELVVDATGVGRPIVDLFRQSSAKVTAVTITGGDTANVEKTRSGEDWRLPKQDLIGTLLTLLHTKRFHVAQELQMTQMLVDELLNFEVKITASANETYSARSGAHDDLVLATALACWHAVKPPKKKIEWRDKPSWM